MFSITVKDVFSISNRKGTILIGTISGIAKIGDYLIDIDNSDKKYKILGLEMIHFENSAKNLSCNPAIMIELDDESLEELKGKTFKSQ